MSEISVSPEKVIQVAVGELGYKEKASNSQLDDPSANAGKNNFTKYARDLGHQNGQPWCQTFVNWCFVQAYGTEIANRLLCGQLSSAYTIGIKDAFQRAGRLVSFNQIQPGDIVWRERTGGGHVELVSGVQKNNGTFSTIGGNTDADGYWNGGAVVMHKLQTSNNWKWVGRPDYNFTGEVFGYDGFDLSQAYAGYIAPTTPNKIVDYTVDIQYEEVSKEVTIDKLYTVDPNEVTKTKITNLLSYPSWVETPYIVLKVGNVSFGTKYSKTGPDGKIGTVTYPNFITGLQGIKINGKLNQYTITMQYQIQYGDDPNLLDKIFSTVGYGKVYLSYGDLSQPSFVYKEEECIITKLTSNVDFNSSRITYVLQCTSAAFGLTAGYYNFDNPPGNSNKPSSVIMNMLDNPAYNLKEVFPGMADHSKWADLIPTDDAAVELQPKTGVDAITYLNYLVSCMSPEGESDSVIKSATYYLVIRDDIYGDNEKAKGPFFEIKKISSTQKTYQSADTYEVDVGYPSQNQVMSFNVDTNNSWALLYNYSESVAQPTYTYDIDNDGMMTQIYSPSLVTSKKENKMTEPLKTWWTRMTQFPINATLVIKGLLRPAMLMTYVRINALFYGQRHVTSGLYVVTKCQDSVDGSGFRTILSLTRIAGDNDYIQKTKTVVTTTVPVAVNIKETVTTNNVPQDVGAGSFIDTEYGQLDANATYYNSLIIPTGLGSDFSSLTHEGTFQGKNYYSMLYDQQGSTGIYRVAAAMKTENGGGIGLAWQTSMLCNLWDTSGINYSDATVLDFIFGGDINKLNRQQFDCWKKLVRPYHFATQAAYAAGAFPGLDQEYVIKYNSYKKQDVLNTQFKVTIDDARIVAEVLKGKRYTDANQQGNMNDYKYIQINGKNDDKLPASNSLKSKLIKNVSILYDSGNNPCLFVGFPGNNLECDAFSKHL